MYPHPVTDKLFPDSSNYETFLRSLKERIRTAQVWAALAVNRELVLLYWQIGREILTRQEQEGWGAKVIERLDKV
jgi:DUF1016 N-terminal domain